MTDTSKPKRARRPSQKITAPPQKPAVGKPKIGRPSSYTDEVATEICMRIMGNRSLKSVCLDDDMPEERTVFRWLLADEHESFRQQYARAMEVRADAAVDETTDIADDGRNDWMERRGKDDAGWLANGENVQRSKLRVDQRFRMAAVMHPKKYGQSNRVELSGGVDLRAKPTEELVAGIAAALASIGKREDEGEGE